MPYVLLVVALLAGMLRAADVGAEPSTMLRVLAGGGVIGLAAALIKLRGRGHSSRGHSGQGDSGQGDSGQGED